MSVLEQRLLLVVRRSPDLGPNRASRLLGSFQNHLGRIDLPMSAGPEVPATLLLAVQQVLAVQVHQALGVSEVGARREGSFVAPGAATALRDGLAAHDHQDRWWPRGLQWSVEMSL